MLRFKTWTVVGALACLGAVGCTIQPVAKDGSKPSSNASAGNGESAESAESSEGGGSIPASVVGSWSFAGSSAGAVYDLMADGTYRYTGVMENSITCTKIKMFQEGTATFDAEKVTFHMIEATTVSEPCNGAPTTKPGTVEDRVKSWRVEGDTLFLWGADCDGSASCSETYSR
ncbi:MAG: hypothetical protein KF819_10785 [Labilithrix sp.]|nr:hypothetical protein [Labilithrix sp.]